MRLKKQAEEIGDQKDSSYYERIKEAAARDRERTRTMKQEYETMKQLIDNTIQVPSKSGPPKLTSENLKNLQNPQENEEIQSIPKKKAVKQKDIPKWAYTQEGVVKKEEDECDDLINFMNSLDYEEYIDDYEVKSMVATLKNRIKEIQAAQRHKVPKGSQKNYEEKGKNEAMSSLSNYEAKSVASEKSQKSIKEIEEKLVKPADWDMHSKGNTNSVAMEERIVKHVADEVLRNHSDLRGVHSNASIRKILEGEARKYFQENKYKKIEGPLIATAADKGEKDFDASNLPYLHRNPAI